MTIQEAQADPGTVTSLLSIYSVDAFILSDSCFAHSHVLVDFTQCINKKVDWIDSQIMIWTPGKMRGLLLRSSIRPALTPAKMPRKGCEAFLA